MPDRWFEDFTLLDAACAPDKLGGHEVTFTPSMTFRGALTHAASPEVDAGGQFVLQSRPLLLHEFDVTLAPGDYVRRESDQVVYRVAGSSEDMRTPAHAGLSFAQVPVERWVR